MQERRSYCIDLMCGSQQTKIPYLYNCIMFGNRDADFCVSVLEREFFGDLRGCSRRKTDGAFSLMSPCPERKDGSGNKIH